MISLDLDIGFNGSTNAMALIADSLKKILRITEKIAPMYGEEAQEFVDDLNDLSDHYFHIFE